ncbi:MAG: hypothetical protein KDH09_17760, partial [Chrysiogenetes bacterium]|nr:hypothetical protein [Chrysiogenetes bacterium]
IDDLVHPPVGDENPDSESFSLQAGPFPIRLLLWKLAAWLRPARPYDLMHILSAALHAANAGLLLILLRQLVSARAALLWTLFFVVYRPANEGVLWASTQPDVMVATFSLLALLAWRRGVNEPRWRLLGVGLAVLAMVTKLSAVVLPFLLLAHAWWVEEGGTARERVRRVLPMLVPLAGLGLIYALWMATHRGLWETNYEAHFLTFGKFPQTGENLARGLLLVRPAALVHSDAFGLSFLGATLFAVWRSRGIVRFGLLWMTGFVAANVFSSGYPAGRYLYAGSVGLILTASALAGWAAAHPLRKRIAMAGAGLWLLASLYAYQRDVRFYDCWGDVHREAQGAVHAHAGEIRAAGALAFARDYSPVYPWSQWLVRYEVGEGIQIETQLPACPGDGRPCLDFGDITEKNITASGSLPEGGCEGHVSFTPPALSE